MGINPIAVAIPVFMVCIGIEYTASRWMGRDVYRMNVGIADLSCGITSQMTGLFTKAVSAGFYIALAAKMPWQLDASSPWVWLGAFLYTDFAYYLWHRWTHEMNVGWASHVVHHQSEDYNLAVALRQSMTSSLTSWPFYLPMALLGVPPLVALGCMALNTLYQFWIHTELVKTLGPIEWIMNTPSHHRVHHGTNPEYLDKNYAGVFIVWDRLFGTFEPEGAQPVYGTVKPLRSFNPLWANVWWLVKMARDIRDTPQWSDKLAVLWRGPGFRAPNTPIAVPGSGRNYNAHGVEGLDAYVAVHFLPVAALTTWVLWVSEGRTPWELAGPATLVFLSTLAWAGLYERRPWALIAELVRLMAVVAIFVTLGKHWSHGLVGSVFLAGSALWVIPNYAPFLPSMREL